MPKKAPNAKITITMEPEVIKIIKEATAMLESVASFLEKALEKGMTQSNSSK